MNPLDNYLRTSIARREFLITSGKAVVGAALAGTLAAQSQAAESKTIKFALIGCGGRGNGAAHDCLEAAKSINADVRLTVLADVFEDRLKNSRALFAKELGIKVAEDHCFLGFDAYKKVMASDVDFVLLCTPPNFRPVHFPAAVEAGKHVFMEKPVAVDPVGCHAIMDAGKVAKFKKLSVVAGTQRRHEKNYLAVAKALNHGDIGKIVGGTIHFCLSGGGIGPKPKNMQDWEWMIHSWNGWCELSGDHIVEQHVHSIDVMNWFLGTHPIQCVSFGGRARRKGGNMYDFFSTDYEFPDAVHIHSMCRQIEGCWDRIGQFFYGQKGIVDITGIVSADHVYIGSSDRKSPIRLEKSDERKSPYVQEHEDLLNSILKGKPINEAQQIAESSLTAIMGRISAYTGKAVTWDEMMASDLACQPSAADFEAGTVKMPMEEPPLPGRG